MRGYMIVLAGVTLSLAGCGTCDSGRKTTAHVERSASQECGAYVWIPPRYETVTEEVCVQEASVQTQEIEAQYQTVSDTVVETPGHWEDCSTPAAYKDVTERVLVKAGYKQWQKVDCASVELNQGEQRGDAYCLVDVPPQYETRTKKVLCTEACTKRNWIPPVYKTVERRVMVSAARQVECPVAPKYEARSKQTLVSEGRWEWRWGTECHATEDNSPRATQASPPPPFSVGQAPVSGEFKSYGSDDGKF